MAFFPKVPVYLFYGNRTSEILAARDQVIDNLLTKEERAENLAEFLPPSNRYGVELVKTLREINGGFSTMSMIAEASKVAVVTNPMEFYGGEGGPAKRTAKKSKKDAGESSAPEKTPSMRIINWLEKVRPEGNNHLILVAFEDEADGREVNEKSPLIQTIARMGDSQRFRDNKAFFRIEDALVSRDASGCLRAIADLWKAGKGDMSVYSAVVRCLRYMLQANIGRERRVTGDPGKMALYFPGAPNLSIYKASDFVQRKYVTRPIPYRTADLIKVYERLVQVYRALRPSSSDLYVPDAQALLQQILMELFASARPA